MRLFSQKFINRYKSAHLIGRRHVHARPYIVPLLGLLMGVAIVGGVLLTRGSRVLHPSNHYVVFLTDNGVRTTINTQEPTVGELVKHLNLHLIPEDVVEPSLDTPIVQDNFRVNVYRARPVTVVSGGTKIVVVTAQRSPRVVAQDAGVNVYPEDNVSFAPGNISENIIGEKVVIDPATPVQLSLYGTPLTVRTHTKTVADMLKEKNVKVDPKDTVTPALDTPISPNLQVSVIRNGVQVVTIEQSIPVPTQYVNDPTLSFGATATRQAGSPGKLAITYQIDVEHGVEVSRTVIQQSTVIPAVPRIVAIGTIIDINGNKAAVMAAAGISSSDYGYVDYIVSHESGWCYTKAQGEHYCPAIPDNPYTPNGYGLCQSTPGYKMASAGADWATSPITQLHWCSDYAARTYGGWYGAYSHWLVHHNW